MKHMKNLLWASPHKPTNQQLRELDYKVDYLSQINPELFKEITQMTWETKESTLAGKLYKFAMDNNYQVLMQPGGSPLFQACLGMIKRNHLAHVEFSNVHTLAIGYAFSQRESVDELQKDGTVIKHVIFKHEGFKYL